MAEEVKSVGKRNTGELTSKSLLSVLRDIRENRRVATLLVAKGANEKCFYFTVGAIRMVTVGPDEGLPLSNILLRRRLITRDQLTAAERKRRSMEVPLKEDAGDEDEKRMVMPLLEDVLGMDEVLDRKDLHDAIATVVRWELEEVFFWSNATYTLWPSSPPIDIYQADMEAHKMSFGVYKMLEEVENDVISWTSKSARMIGGHNEVYRSSNVPNLSELSPVAQILLRASRSPSANVHYLLRSTRHSGDTPFSAIESLQSLVDMGALEIAVSSAPPLRSPADLRKDVVNIEEWLPNLLDGLNANEALANIYEKLDEPEKSIEFRRELAEKLASEGAYDGALVELKRILAISERDFPAYERILELLEQTKQRGELKKVSRKYAELLSFNRLFNRARRMWQYFLNIVPDDIEARKQLVDAHLQVNDDHAAQQELMNIVKIAEQGGDQVQIEEALKDVLKVTPENQQVIDRYTDVVGFKTAILFRRFIGASLGLVILGALYIGFQVNVISRKFLRARDTAIAEANKKKYEDAHGVLQGFVENQTSLFTNFVKVEAEKTQRKIRQTARSYYGSTQKRLLGLALWQKRNQKIPEAIETLKTLKSELGKVSTNLCPDKKLWLTRCNIELQSTLTRFRNAKARLFLAERKVESGRSQQAFEIYKQLSKTNTWLEGLNLVPVPIRIQTFPSNAKIFNRSIEVGRSPLTIKVPLGEKIEISAELDGYERRSANPDKRWTWPLVIDLQKKKAWAVQTNGPIESNIVKLGELVVGGDRSGTLVAVKTPKGDGPVEVLWRRSLGISGDVEGLAMARGVLVAILGSGKIQSFDPKTGAKLWREDASLMRPALLKTVKYGNVVIYVDPDGKVVARRSDTGKQLWKKDHGALSVAPIVEGTRILVCGVNGELRFLEGRTGNLIKTAYKLSEEPLPSPVITTIKKDRRYIFTLETGKILIVSFSSSGRAAIRRTDIDLPVKHTPIALKEKLFIVAADDEGSVLCLDITTRKTLFKKSLKIDMTGPPFVTDKAIYVQARDGLHALNINTGNQLWFFQTDLPLRAPAFAEGGKIIMSDSKQQMLSIFE
jgi:outer membrane protein assembly factor BamB/tetratricopeptide (TPR) repeat protein